MIESKHHAASVRHFIREEIFGFPVGLYTWIYIEVNIYVYFLLDIFVFFRHDLNLMRIMLLVIVSTTCFQISQILKEPS